MQHNLASRRRSRRLLPLLGGVLALALASLAHAQTTVTSSETDPVKGRAPTVATAVITYTGSGANGEVLAGDVLTATYTLSDLDSDAPDTTATDATLQWTVDGEDVGTAGNKTYTVRDTDAGKRITFALVPHTDSATTDPYQGARTIAADVSAGGVVTPAADGLVLAVTISPSPIVGTLLTAKATCVGTCGTDITYQWQIETAIGSNTYMDIPGATGTTYTPVREQQKRKLKVRAAQTAQP